MERKKIMESIEDDFTLNINNIDFMRNALNNKNTRAEALKNLWESYLFLNYGQNQIDRILKFYAMPEMKVVTHEGQRGDLEIAFIEALDKTLQKYNVNTAQGVIISNKVEDRKDITPHQTISSYLLLNTKHDLVEFVCEKSKTYYPRASRYTQELLVLAHKGGISDCVNNHSVEEVTKAVNHAMDINAAKTNEKRIRKNQPLKRPVYASYGQVSKMMETYSLSKNYIPTWDNVSHQKKFKCNNTNNCIAREEVTELPFSYLDIYEIAEKIFSKPELIFFNWWFSKKYFENKNPIITPHLANRFATIGVHASMSTITNQRETLIIAMDENGLLEPIKNMICTQRKNKGVNIPVNFSEYCDKLKKKRAVNKIEGEWEISLDLCESLFEE